MRPQSDRINRPTKSHHFPSYQGFFVASNNLIEGLDFLLLMIERISTLILRTEYQVVSVVFRCIIEEMRKARPPAAQSSLAPPIKVHDHQSTLQFHYETRKQLKIDRKEQLHHHIWMN